ncbi:MAG: TonB family protein [Fibrobacterota bacterium]
MAHKLVHSGGGSIAPKDLKGPLIGTGHDKRFLLIFLFSFLAHLALMAWLGSMDIKQQEVTIEKIPERLVKVIMDKPKPEVRQQAAAAEQSAAEEKQEVPDEGTEEYKQYTKKKARQNIARRARTTQKKIQSSQLMQLLVGKGSSSRSTSFGAKDMLAGTRAKKFDLDNMLAGRGGLTTEEDIAKTSSRKGLASKDIKAGVSKGSGIKNLLSDEGPSINLKKIGSVSFKKPEFKGDVASTGNRSQSSITKTIREQQRRLRLVHNRWLKRFPDLSGKLTIRFTILPSGKVFDIVVLENTTNNKEFERDIVRRIKLWRFGPIDDKGDFKITLPLLFQVGA